MNEDLPTLLKEEQERRGRMLAEVLFLEANKKDRYDTQWGDKTTLGLYLTVKRIVEEGEA